MEDEMAKDPSSRLVIIEIGCGTRVPAVRIESEEVVRDTLAKIGEAVDGCAAPSGGGGCGDEERGREEEEGRWWEHEGAPRAVMIRINPDFPHNPRDRMHTIPIRSGALDAIRAIDECTAELR
jgi:hypothetical protein